MARAHLLALGVGLLMAIAYVVLPASSLSELLLYDGVVIGSATATWLNARRATPEARPAWRLIATAMALLVGGEVVWWWYQSRGLDPFPSVGDVLFLAGYIPLGLGASQLAGAGHRDKDRSAWLDAGVLTVVTSLLLWAAVMESYLLDSSMTLTTKAISLAYPVFDLFVLGFALRLSFSRTARTPAGSLLVVGLLVWLVADAAFLWFDATIGYDAGTLVDLGWLVGFLLVAAAAAASTTRPSATAHPLRATDEGASVGRGRLAVVLGAVLVPQLVLFSQLVRLDVATLAMVFAAATSSLVAQVLVALRLWALLGHARRLEARRGSDRLAALTEQSSDAILLVDRNGITVYASPAVTGLWGVDGEEVVGRPLPEWIEAGDGRALARIVGGLVGTPLGTLVALEGRVRAADGTVHSVEGTARNLVGDRTVNAFVVTLRDVTDRKHLEAQLEHRAFHDDLTGLPNRTLFTDRVHHALQRAQRHGAGGAAVMFVDLDDFKAVNDGMGHSAGDALLQEVAARLRLCVRPGDTVARLGGDEFAVLLEDIDTPDQAEQLGRRILEMLQMPMQVLDSAMGTPASIGIALARPDSTSGTLLRDADTAMYAAKERGKGRVALFDDALRRRAERHLSLKIDLPVALAEGQFVVAYQPVHALADRRLVGFEALLRWNHPTRGLLPPGEFVDAAEQSGLIVPLGRAVLAEACAQAVRWTALAGRELTVSVNVSGVQLDDPQFYDDVVRTLATSGLPARQLVLELTESVLIEGDRAGAITTSLRALGVGLAIDDFGTGYSSLAYLQRFPVTAVKIDRSFVADLSTRQNVALIRSIVAIADTLGLATIAEGVENEWQLEALARLECHCAQGYGLGRPMPPATIGRILGEGQVRV